MFPLSPSAIGDQPIEGDLNELRLGRTFATGIYACHSPYMPRGH